MADEEHDLGWATFNDAITLLKEIKGELHRLVDEEHDAILQRAEIISVLNQIESRFSITKIIAIHEPPVVRPDTEITMASVTFLKKSALTNKPRLHKAGDPLPPAFAFIDNEDDSVTVSGMDDAGDVIDISAVATLGTPVSSDITMVTADAPVGMTFVEHALAVGTPSVSVVATWNDGSIGPFTYTDNLIITAPPPGPVTSLVVTHGTPTIR